MAFEQGNQAAAYDPEDVKEAKRIFLETWDKFFNVSTAARACGMSRKTVWRWRREDKAFNEAYQAIWSHHLDTVQENLYKISSDEKANANARVTASFGLLNTHRSKTWKPKTGGSGQGSVTFQLIIGGKPQLSLSEPTQEVEQDEFVEGEVVDDEDSELPLLSTPEPVTK